MNTGTDSLGFFADAGTRNMLIAVAVAVLLVVVLTLLIVSSVKRNAAEKKHREKIAAGREMDVVLQREQSFSGVKLLDYDKQKNVFTLEIWKKEWVRKVKYYTECNFVKAPHYTPWQEKTTSKKVTVNGTKEMLESLPTISDATFSENAEKIVEAVCPQAPSLKPTWYQKTALQIAYEKYVTDLDEKCDAAILKKENELAQLDLDYEKQLKEFFAAEEAFNAVEFRSKMSVGAKKAKQASKVNRKFDKQLANLRMKADKIKLSFPEYFEKKAATEAAITKFATDRENYLRQAQASYRQKLAQIQGM